MKSLANTTILARLTIITYVILGGIFTSCTRVKQFKNDKLFKEGNIEYSISYNIKESWLTESDLKEIHGAKMITEFKDGNRRDEYYNEDNELVRVSVLDLKNNIYSAKFSYSDTVYYSDIRHTDFITEVEKRKDKYVNNEPCWVISTKSWEKQALNKMDTYEDVYFISQELLVNPKWYKNYKDGGFDRIVKLAPGIIVKHESISKAYTMEKNISKIENQHISDSAFILESSFMKKMN